MKEEKKVYENRKLKPFLSKQCTGKSLTVEITGRITFPRAVSLLQPSSGQNTYHPPKPMYDLLLNYPVTQLILPPALPLPIIATHCSGPGRSDICMYHLHPPADAKTLDLAKRKKMVTHFSLPKEFQPLALSNSWVQWNPFSWLSFKKIMTLFVAGVMVKQTSPRQGMGTAKNNWWSKICPLS